MDRRSRQRARRPDSRLLVAAASFVARRPKPVVAVWLVAMAVLALLGTGLESKISAGTVYVAGAPAEQAHDIALREFGREDTLVVMLRGPREALDRQGAELGERLQRLPGTVVISPWSARGSIGGLRPSPRVAALLVSVGDTAAGSSSDIIPSVRKLIDERVKPPVRTSVAGGPAVVSSLRDTIERASAFGERLAIPVLLIVLLFVCRSVLAAAMPVVIGALVAGATRGILFLLSGAVSIDSISIGVAGMIGLALGVDYSLLIVARFREELEHSDDVDRAVRTTVVRTGRAILPAGAGLVLAMLAALFLLPGSFVGSVVLAAGSATVLSVVSAILFAPAVLSLLGTRLNVWSLPRRRASGSFAMAWSRRLSTRPAAVLGMLFILFLCSFWAFALRTNIGVASLLPRDDPGREAQERVARVLGPGWVAPFEVLVEGGEEPVTTPKRLRALAAFQRRVQNDRGVEAMAGFATLAKATDALASVPGRLRREKRGMAQLGEGVGRLERGADASSAGFARAAGGAAALASATETAGAGSRRLADGLNSGAAGSAKLSDGLGKASDGSASLAQATSRTSSGASRLAARVAAARKQAGEALESGAPLSNALKSGEASVGEAPLGEAESKLAAAWEALQRMNVGREDPQYSNLASALREAGEAVSGVDPETKEGQSPGSIAGSLSDAAGQFELASYLAERQQRSQDSAQKGIDKLANASAKLDRGLRRVLRGSRRMRLAIGRLSARGKRLPDGLQQLSQGAGQLLTGLGRLETGAGALSSRLEDGAGSSERLGAGLRRLRSAGGHGAPGQAPFEAQSPGFFDSGYYYLAGLDGASPERRKQVSYLVNLEKGGSAARMLVVPTDGAATPGATATEHRLTAAAGRLARETDARVVVGGLSPALVELNSAVRGQAPLARLVLSLVTIFILVFVTRSLTLPIVAALLSLLTVSVTFGLLAILFNGSLLGGPGFVDSSVVPATIILTFGLAVDYEAFILARIREEYLRTGSTLTAISEGLTRTAPVIGGAALIMVAVFLAFAISPLMFLRNLGVALAIGVLIDAYVVRFVLLPAAMRALGDRCWWLPRWLDRILPGAGSANGDWRNGAAPAAE